MAGKDARLTPCAPGAQSDAKSPAGRRLGRRTGFSGHVRVRRVSVPVDQRARVGGCTAPKGAISTPAGAIDWSGPLPLQRGDVREDVAGESGGPVAGVGGKRRDGGLESAGQGVPELCHPSQGRVRP